MPLTYKTHYYSRLVLPLLALLYVLNSAAILAEEQVSKRTYSYHDKLNVIEQQIKRFKGVVTVQPSSWLKQESVAKAYLDRAKLTGKFEDYVAADNALAESFKLASAPAGPTLTRASMKYAMHRIPDIERDLAQAESALLVSGSDRRIISEIRADVFLNTGHYAQAKNAYDELESNHPTVTSATRLANYHREIADYSAAEQWLDIAVERNDKRNPHLRSWFQLQRGILDLDQGNLDEALEHYNKGLEHFSGYWLIEEHVAEIHALQGKDQQAEQQYRDLIKRTDSPLFMSALADILSNRSDSSSQKEAKYWFEKTKSTYQEQIRILPELIAGHAIDFFIDTNDKHLALQLAMSDHRLRPGGESALKLVQAHVLNSQLIEADNLLNTIFSSPYRSASLHTTAASLYRAMGKSELAERQQSIALSINPLAL